MRRSRRGGARGDIVGGLRARVRCRSICCLLSVGFWRSEMLGYSPQEAAHNVLEQSCGLLLNELGYHVAEDSSNSVKSLVGGTDVVETVVIQQNLLDDEDGNSLAELRTGLHDTQTERNDLGGQKKVDDVGGIVLD